MPPHLRVRATTARVASATSETPQPEPNTTGKPKRTTKAEARTACATSNSAPDPAEIGMKKGAKRTKAAKPASLDPVTAAEVEAVPKSKGAQSYKAGKQKNIVKESGIVQQLDIVTISNDSGTTSLEDLADEARPEVTVRTKPCQTRGSQVRWDTATLQALESQPHLLERPSNTTFTKPFGLFQDPTATRRQATHSPVKRAAVHGLTAKSKAPRPPSRKAQTSTIASSDEELGDAEIRELTLFEELAESPVRDRPTVKNKAFWQDKIAITFDTVDTLCDPVTRPNQVQKAQKMFIESEGGASNIRAGQHSNLPSGPVQQEASRYPILFAPVARAQHVAYSGHTLQVHAPSHVVPAPQTSTVPEPPTLSRSSKRLTDLPEEAQLHFKSIMVLLRVFAGKHPDPWCISPEEIDVVLPAVYSKVVGSPGRMSPIQWRIARNIVVQRLTEWRSNLGDAALEATKVIFGGMTTDQVAKQVAYALDGPLGDENFHYREILRTGIVGPLQSDYIIHTLATHESFTYWDRMISNPHAQGRPRGALLITLAAVERALRMWTTGNMEEANKGSFNKATWGTPERTVTDTETINDLQDAEWDDIMKAAYAVTIGASEDVPEIEETRRRKGGLRARAPLVSNL